MSAVTGTQGGAAEPFTGDPVAKTLPDLVTPTQLSLIKAEARASGVDADAECRRLLGCSHIDLTKQAAGYFYRHLCSLPREGAAQDPAADG